MFFHPCVTLYHPIFFSKVMHFRVRPPSEKSRYSCVFYLVILYFQDGLLDTSHSRFWKESLKTKSACLIRDLVKHASSGRFIVCLKSFWTPGLPEGS